MTEAFEALEAFPALVASRDRVLRLLGEERVSAGEMVTAVETDLALTIAVLRLASRGSNSVDSVVKAVDELSPESVQGLVAEAHTYDFFERSGIWEGAPEQFRLHGIATQRAAERLAAEIDYEHRDRLMVSALLHDLGKLVLIHAYPGYPGEVHMGARTPEERLQCERRELGVDHALVGGVLLRRWGIDKSIAQAVERHHSEETEGEASVVQLADMLAHYGQGRPVSPGALLACARRVGLGAAELRAVMYDVPQSSSKRPRELAEPCPLSQRELQALRGLAAGQVYKQIAHDLGLSTSTVRTHLHNVYSKLGAVDRAQAVLLAASHGWL
ncbi:MAG TPA: HDOD domain-containing protein [Solirubrobacteraceae bacterium]|nr:HDOD domain-containing protein [Solirubrobacteraceae bacterium]